MSERLYEQAHECSFCEGTGRFQGPECHVCFGTGWIWRHPHTDEGGEA